MVANTNSILFSLRIASKEVIERFKKQAEKEGISHGELFEKMESTYMADKNDVEGQEIKLLVSDDENTYKTVRFVGNKIHEFDELVISCADSVNKLNRFYDLDTSIRSKLKELGLQHNYRIKINLYKKDRQLVFHLEIKQKEIPYKCKYRTCIVTNFAEYHERVSDLIESIITDGEVFNEVMTQITGVEDLF